MMAFCTFLSTDNTSCSPGLRPGEPGEQLEPIDWRPFVSEPYVGKWQNEWPMTIYESVLRLIRILSDENADQIEARYREIRREYFRLKDTPKVNGSMEVGGAYARAYNKKYYGL